MSRGEITDKWHRACKQCGKRVHVNVLRGAATHHCERCGSEYFIRDITEASGNG